jgi:hypothetical protein
MSELKIRNIKGYNATLFGANWTHAEKVNRKLVEYLG